MWGGRDMLTDCWGLSDKERMEPPLRNREEGGEGEEEEKEEEEKKEEEEGEGEGEDVLDDSLTGEAVSPITTVYRNTIIIPPYTSPSLLPSPSFLLLYPPPT